MCSNILNGFNHETAEKNIALFVDTSRQRRPRAVSCRQKSGREARLRMVARVHGARVHKDGARYKQGPRMPTWICFIFFESNKNPSLHTVLVRGLPFAIAAAIILSLTLGEGRQCRQGRQWRRHCLRLTSLPSLARRRHCLSLPPLLQLSLRMRRQACPHVKKATHSLYRPLLMAAMGLKAAEDIDGQLLHEVTRLRFAASS